MAIDELLRDGHDSTMRLASIKYEAQSVELIFQVLRQAFETESSLLQEYTL